MNLITMKCPECGASLDIPDERKIFFCSYCGNKIYIDDGSHTITHIHIDKTREKELQYEENKRADERKIVTAKEREKLFVAIAIVFAIISVIVAFLLIKNDFNIMFNFCLLLIGCITAVFRMSSKVTSIGIVVCSVTIAASSISFIAMRDDFNTTFTIGLAVCITSHMIASIALKKK